MDYHAKYLKYKVKYNLLKKQLGGIRLVDPGNYMIEASFGREYYHLSQIYPNWAQDLHQKGDVITEELLSIIYKYGILEWYCRKLVQKSFQKIIFSNVSSDKLASYDNIYSYENNAKYFINNLSKMYKYDILKYLELCDKKLLEIYQKNKKNVFLKEHQNEMLYLLNNITTCLQPYHEIQNLNQQETVVINKLVEHISSSELNMKIGIAFQRYKVVAEKISNNIQKNINTNDTINQLKLYANKIEMLLNDLQTMIYYYVFENSQNIETIAEELYKDKNYNINPEIEKINLYPEFLNEPEYNFIVENLDLLILPVSSFDVPRIIKFLDKIK